SSPPRLVPSGSVTPSVPMVPQGAPPAFSAAAIHCTVVVLPLVPVTATTDMSCEGLPYQRCAVSPSRVTRPGTSSIGTEPPAAIAAGKGACTTTAAAPA